MEIELADFGEKKLELSRKKMIHRKSEEHNERWLESSEVFLFYYSVREIVLQMRNDIPTQLQISLSLYKNLSYSLFSSLCSLANSSSTTKVPSVGIDTAADDRKNATFLPQLLNVDVVPRVACSSWAAAVVIVSSRLVSRATTIQEL